MAAKSYPQKSLGGTSTAQVVVAPNDSADLPDGPCFGLSVVTEGLATWIDASGNQITGGTLFKGYNPISVKRIFATGLTAAGILALY